jgi:hypothetical protein
MRYRPVANVGAWSELTGDHDNYSQCTCDVECNECYWYCGDSNNCTEEEFECEYYGDYDNCTYDCNSHTCGMDYGEYCNCENIDDNVECKLDNLPSKNCVFTDIPCVNGRKSNGVGDAIMLDLPKQIPLSSIRVRLEGAIINVDRDNVFKFSSGTTSMEYFKFGVSGTTNGHVKGCVTTSTLPTNTSYFKELSTIIPNEDFDITVGNGYIYDNNTSANIYTGTTYAEQRWLTRIYLSLSVFRIKRVRIYNGEELISDLTPKALRCPMTNDGNLDEYGETAFVIKDDVTGLVHSIKPGIGIQSCAPTCATALQGPAEWVSGGTGIIVPIQNNATSSAVTFRFEGQFLSSNGVNPFVGLTANTMTNSNYNRHNVSPL